MDHRVWQCDLEIWEKKNVLFPFLYYSENIQDVLITVAEAKCDVEYSNKTYIICMTNAHTPSGWAPVHVNIRRMGMAKLVMVLLGRLVWAIEKLALWKVK